MSLPPFGLILQEYYNRPNDEKSLRLGQWFIMQYYDELEKLRPMPHPELFYCDLISQCFVIIKRDYYPEA